MPFLASWIEKKFLSGLARSPTATILPLRSASLSTPEFGLRQHAHAAAMRAGGDLDVKALLQRLQPAQRHAEAGVGFAGRDGLQQLVGGAAVVDEFDVEVMLLEEAVVDRDWHRREADRAGIPRKLQFARRPCSAPCASDAVLQIGNSEKSITGATARNGNACAPKTPSGAATAAAAPERNSVRRSSNRLPRCSFSDIVLLLCTHVTTLAATREPRCRLAP